MVAFLKKRHEQKLASRAPEGDKETKMDISEPQPTTKPSGTTTKRDDTEKNADSSERSQPGRWLHMDVVEKEKMEWMTDVPLYPQDTSSSGGEGEEAREVRFSLDGLVIPRSVVLPVHLGLHHHGDEPQVSLSNNKYVYTGKLYVQLACTDVHYYYIYRCSTCIWVLAILFLDLKFGPQRVHVDLFVGEPGNKAVCVLMVQTNTHMHILFIQAAGYTLSELLPLCRSSILQQRVLALNTLARITQRGRQGEYTGVIEGSVVGRLLDAEVPLLLRYALDDSNDAVFCVAIHALHSLLVLMPEEVSKLEELLCDPKTSTCCMHNE